MCGSRRYRILRSVFGIAGKVAREHLPSIGNPPVKHRQEQRHEQQRPPRTERKRRAHNQKEDAKVQSGAGYIHTGRRR